MVFVSPRLVRYLRVVNVRLIAWRCVFAPILAACAATMWSVAVLGQPGPRYDHTSIDAATRRSMIVFGGTNGAGAIYNEVWQLGLGDSTSWNLVTASGTPPATRARHSAVFDPDSNRMIVFGGLTAEGGLHELDDVWSLDLAGGPRWNRLQPTGGGPAARFYHSAIYDPPRHRMVVFGGSSLAGTVFSDVWCLWLTPAPRWELIASDSVPLQRDHHVAIRDPARDRMIVFGGNASNDVWALPLAGGPWTRLAPTGVAVPALSGHVAVYDSAGDRMVVFGGNDGNDRRNDVWSLSLGGAPEWSRVIAPDPPDPRDSHAAIVDPVARRMIVFGGWTDTPDRTWALALDAPERWGPQRARIETAPDTLRPPSVTLGDTVSAAFVVTNRGMNPLRVTAANWSGPSGALLTTPPPFRLSWNRSLAETLFLATNVAGPLEADLALESDDAASPERRVHVSLEVRALDFDTRVLGSEPVPLGQAVAVVVTPRPGVRIARGTLFYRIADGLSSFTSDSLIPLSSDFIANVPAWAVTEHGVEFYVAVENGGFTASRPSGAPLVVDTIEVARPATLTAVPRPNSGPDFLAGREIGVDADLPEGAVFVAGELHFRRAGDATEQSMPLHPLSLSGRPTATIPDTVVTARGVEFWMEVQTLGTVLRHPPGRATESIRIRVPALAEPVEHPALRYRLLGVPLDFGGDGSVSLYDLLADQLGTYDPTRWRAFAFDVAAQGNVELSIPPSATFHPEPGRAFWLITREPHKVDTRPVSGLSTPTGSPFTIALEPGWNLIADPFAFPVAWSDVRRDTDLVSDPIRFDPARGSVGDYAYDGTPAVLEPFEGYFVHAAGATTLLVSARGADAASVVTAAGVIASPGENDGWRIALGAQTAAAADGSIEMGLCPGARAGFDRLDQRKPPRSPGDAWVRATVAHRDWGQRSGEFRRDLRAPGARGETWEIEVTSGARAELVRLAIEESASRPPGVFVRLIDREQGTVVEIEGRNSRENRKTVGTEDDAPNPRIVSLGARPYRLALVAGDEDYVSRAARSAAAVPARLALDPIAPNPVRAAARIGFGLPHRATVKLEVYSVLGQRVATLLDGQALEAGRHARIWEGTTAGGRPVPSGLYLVRLEAESEIRTARVTIVR